MKKHGILAKMWRLYKKWWLLQEFAKAISFHTLKEDMEFVSSGKRVLLDRKFFIIGNDEYPGIAYKSLWFKWLFRWQKSETKNIRLKRAVADSNDIFDACVQEEYINAPSLSYPHKGKNFDQTCGVTGLIQMLAGSYPSVWLIVFAVSSTLLALNYKEIWASLVEWIKNLPF